MSVWDDIEEICQTEEGQQAFVDGLRELWIQKFAEQENIDKVHKQRAQYKKR